MIPMSDMVGFITILIVTAYIIQATVTRDPTTRTSYAGVALKHFVAVLYERL